MSNQLFTNPGIFKAYDIRGIYGSEITDDNFEHIIRAIYTFFVQKSSKSKLQVVLGRDMRVFSEKLSDIAKNTLVAMGAEVIDIGLAPTPTMYYASLKYGYDAGIHVTASHNPPEYAGVKFVMRNGDKLIKIGGNSGMKEVQKLAVETQAYAKDTNDGTTITRSDILKAEIDESFQEVGITPKDIKPFKAVADPGNGMGSLFIDELYSRIPGELVRMYYELDGNFPNHESNPLKYETLADLQKRVVAEKANLGIAPDGDGDRVFFIDEKGEIVPATLITSLIAHEAMKKQPGSTIVADIRYIRNVQNVVENLGGNLYVSRVGHAFISEDVNKTDAFFAGESSGHFFFHSTGGAESTVRVIIYVLMVMSREGKPLSEILAHLKSSHESGEFNYLLPDGANAKDFLKEISETYKDGEVSWLDGIAVTYPDWRFNIRTSNTEPALRLNVEGKDKELVDQKRSELTDIILKTGAKSK